jgi:hypothetical protein
MESGGIFHIRVDEEDPSQIGVQLATFPAFNP